MPFEISYSGPCGYTVNIAGYDGGTVYTKDEHHAILSKQKEILRKYEAALRIIAGGILPDGDHVDLSTMVYADEVLEGKS